MYWPCVLKGFQRGRRGNCAVRLPKSIASMSLMPKNRVAILIPLTPHEDYQPPASTSSPGISVYRRLGGPVTANAAECIGACGVLPLPDSTRLRALGRLDIRSQRGLGFTQNRLPR